MPDGSPDERRKHERFELQAQVSLRRGGETASMTVLNISAGGMLLINDARLAVAVGDGIRAEFDIPELGIAFAIDATIVRVVEATTKAPALGAMWSSSDATATAGLSQLLWKLKGS